MLKNGIDISHHNGDASDEIRCATFVLIRAGYGKNHIDSKFYENVKLCEKYNKPYGVYWFSYATNIEEAAFEAIYMLDAIRKCSYKPSLPVFIDWEEDSETNLNKHGIKFTWPLYNSFVTIFCKICEICGYYAGIYCDKNHFNHLNTRAFCCWVAWWNGVENFDIKDSAVIFKQWRVDKDHNLDINIMRDEKLIDIIKTKHFNGW